ncbi:RNA pseudouridine synthase 7 [Capsicum baccatum]|uniref:RNA pseudouridine synthase 7 n=1 Tax=Capsicum baccatum TaxID=33114 RepID=A0A2G2X2A6_CAPBA|nr:RNA pseudouridine synthase 7 [Capsicum baccatum]
MHSGIGMIYQHIEIVPYITPQTPQISRYPSLSSLDNIFDSYRPQHFENAPNFTSSPVSISIDIPDATNNLENLNAKIEDNELDDANNEVNDNDPEDESKGCDTTIQHDELSKRRVQLLLSFVGLVLPNLKVRPIMYEGNEEGLWLHCVKYSGLDWIYECPNPDWFLIS